MRNILLTALMLLGTTTAQESRWLTDFEAAKAAARKQQKVILADFTGSDWCGWCIKLKDEVFDKPEFRKWAAENVVLLELDFPRNKALPAALKKQNRELRKKYGVRGYPTVLFLDADGKQIGKSGYLRGGPKNWIQKADEQIAAHVGAGAAWPTDYQAALARAKKEGKLVLADFTGSDWCGWCIKLKDEVFDKPAFQKWAAENVVLLELDFPRRKPQSAALKKQNAKLRDQHGVRGYPTILFLDANGKQVGKSGYVRGGAKAWIQAVEKQLGAKLQPRRKRARRSD